MMLNMGVFFKYKMKIKLGHYENQRSSVMSVNFSSLCFLVVVVISGACKFVVGVKGVFY